MMSVQTATLTHEDLQSIESTPGVKAAYGELLTKVVIEYKGQNASALAIGIDGGVFEAMSGYFKIDQGRNYKDSETRVVVLTTALAENLFDDEIKPGRTIKINGLNFQVVGTSSMASSAFSSAASSFIYIPLRDAMDLTNVTYADVAYEEIFAPTLPGADPNVVAEQVEIKLRNNHKVSEEDQDFTVFTPDFMMEALGAITGTLNLFLGGLASIAVVVGGVGIANTMFASVLERTREIGVLKALGARSWDIQEMFLLESGLMGLVGGILGIVLGYGGCCVVRYFGVPALVTTELVIFALLFAVGVGVVSGWLPARQASQLEPVEALRYE